jgi:DtxR family Mn-dependent transcriptional regulator
MVEILGIDPEVAVEDACRMEHFLSAPSLQRLTKFVEFVSVCPAGEPGWLKGFNYYFEHGERDQKLLARCPVEEK